MLDFATEQPPTEAFAERTLQILQSLPHDPINDDCVAVKPR